jgi:hypothetical protein
LVFVGCFLYFLPSVVIQGLIHHVGVFVFIATLNPKPTLDAHGNGEHRLQCGQMEDLQTEPLYLGTHQSPVLFF